MNDNIDALELLKSKAQQCKQCRLCTTRNTVVFGEGGPNAQIMFIGEGPGRQEDLSGRPFVGRAGELLTRIIENGMGLKRDDVYIANLVKCRPTVDLKMQKDRPPDRDEMLACVPFLHEQVEIIKPRVIIALGSPAAKYLMKTETGITRLRGTWGSFMDIPVMPTYHPSYVLRNGGDKSSLRKDVWEDIKKVLVFLDLPLPH